MSSLHRADRDDTPRYPGQVVTSKKRLVRRAGSAGLAFCFGAERHGRTITLPHVTDGEQGAHVWPAGQTWGLSAPCCGCGPDRFHTSVAVTIGAKNHTFRSPETSGTHPRELITPNLRHPPHRDIGKRPARRVLTTVPSSSYTRTRYRKEFHRDSEGSFVNLI